MSQDAQFGKPLAPPLPFGNLLKFWRAVYGLSQETLAYAIDSSPRHISRMENGHVHPSMEMVNKLAHKLGLLERDTHHLLIAAGFITQPAKVDFHSAELKWLRKAMKLTLRALDPYPSVLINSSGKIMMVNEGWVNFYTPMVGHNALTGVSNHFDFLFSLHNNQPASGALQDALSLILMSMQQEVLLRPDADIEALLERLMRTNAVPDNWAQRAAQLAPMASFRIELEIEGKLQRFFSVSQTVGALGPNAYVSEPRLTINTLYPEDDDATPMSPVTRHVHHPRLFY